MSLNPRLSPPLFSKVPDHPLVIILQQLIQPSSFLDARDQQIASFLSLIPQLDKQSLHKVNLLLNENKTINEILAPIATNFIFHEDTLSNFLSIIETVSFPPSTPKVVLYFVISWSSCSDLQAISFYFPELIKMLLLTENLFQACIFNYCISIVIDTFLNYGQSPFPSSIVQQVFKKCSSENFDVVCSVLNNVLFNRDLISSTHLIEIITLSISQNPESFKNCNFQMVASTLIQPLYEFNIYALNCIAALGLVKEDSFLTECFSNLPSILFSKMHSSDQSDAHIQFHSFPLSDPNSIITKLDCSNQIRECSFQISTKTDNSSPLEPLAIEEFETKYLFSDLLSKEQLSLLKMLVPILSRVLTCYVSTFFHSLAHIVESAILSGKESLDIFIAFLFLLMHVSTVTITLPLYSLLSTVFQPGISVFSKCPDFDFVAFLRKTVLDIFACHSPKHIQTLLQDHELHPFLFTDIIGRIHFHLSNFDLMKITQENTLCSISRVSSKLSSLERKYSCNLDSQNETDGDLNRPKDQKEQNELMKALQEANSTIFLFFFSILENPSVASQCFSSTTFASGFLARVLDPSLQAPIISAFRQVLTRFEGIDPKILEPSIQYIIGIIDFCRHVEYEAEIALNLVNCINEVVAHKTELTTIFFPLLSPVTLFATSHPSAHFLSSAIQLMLQIATGMPYFEAPDEAVKQLSLAIRTADGLEPSETTLSGLLGIIAHSRSVSNSAMFVIRDPAIIKLLFSVLRTRNNCVQYLQFFDQLCHHSLENLKQCHRGELDYLLTMVIIHYPKGFWFRGVRIDMQLEKDDISNVILPFLFYMISWHCTPQVAEKIIEILIPKRNTDELSLSSDNSNENLKKVIMEPSKCNSLSEKENEDISRKNNKEPEFSTFCMNLLTHVSALTAVIPQSPQIILPLGSVKRFECDQITSSMFPYGFTVQFWLYIDAPLSLISSKKPKLLSIFDDDLTSLNITVQGTSLTCRLMMGGKSSFAALTTNFPSCQWTQVSLVFDYYENGTVGLAYSQNNRPSTSFSAGIWKLNGNITFSFGGIDNSSTPSSPTSSYINLQSLIQNSEVGDKNPFAYLGPFRVFDKSFEKDELNDISTMGALIKEKYAPILSVGFFNSTQNSEFSKFRFQAKGPSNLFMRNILETLSTPHITKLILPLFSYINESPPLYPELLIDIVQAIVNNTSTNDHTDDFKTISFYLAKSPSRLSYNIYAKFFSIIDNCSNSHSILSLVEHILFNFEIWYSLKGDQLLRIAAHWSQGLFHVCQSALTQICSFRKLLSLIRIYFWFDPIEIELIKGGPNSKGFKRSDDLDIVNVRQYLDSILLALSQKFTIADGRTLLSHCAVCQDSRQITAFLKLFSTIVSKTNSQNSIQNTLYKPGIIKSLYQQFKAKQEDRFCSALKVLKILTGSKFSKHLDSVLSIINPIFYTKALFETIQSNLHDFPDCFPLLIITAINLDLVLSNNSSSPMFSESNHVHKTNKKKFNENSFSARASETLNNLILTQSQVEDITSNKMWALWIFILCARLKRYKQPLTFLTNVTRASASLTVIDTVISTLDLLQIVTCDEWEKVSVFLLTNIAEYFIKSDDRELQSGLILRCIKSILLHIRPTISDNFRKSFLNSPFGSYLNSDQFLYDSNKSQNLISEHSLIPKNLDEIIEILMNFDKFTANNDKDVTQYHFEFKIQNDPLSIPKQNQLILSVIQDLISSCHPQNETINFWSKYFSYWTSIIDSNSQTKVDIPMSKILNEAAPGYHQKVSDGNFKLLQNLYNSLINQLQNAKASGIKAITSMETSEIGIANGDIDIYWQIINQNFQSNSQKIAFLRKQEMHECSPWHSPLTHIKKDFRYTTFSSPCTPLIKRTLSKDDIGYAESNDDSYLDKEPPQLSTDAFNPFFKYDCYYIKIGREIKAIFLICTDSIVLLHNFISKTYMFRDIEMILERSRFHRHTSLEIYTNDHKSYLIDFYPTLSSQVLSDFNSRINLNTKRVQTIPSYQFFSHFNYTQDWVSGKMSNFDYLCTLNAFSGRSFNDTVIYPIFPWILRTYVSSDFSDMSFNNPAALRDLRVPIAQAKKDRKNEERMFFLSPLAPGQISFFLHSLDPFSNCELESMFPILESVNSFKNLSSVLTAIKRSENCTEIPPEFFCCPEAFPSNFDFSPFESAIDFIYAHRKALESTSVSACLQKWIDLIFGVNSCGKQAILHENVYNPLLFDGLFKDEPISIVSAVKKCGQMPSQLFHHPHPPKFSSFKNQSAFGSSIIDYSNSKYKSRQSSFRNNVIRSLSIEGKPPKLSLFVQNGDELDLYAISEFDNFYIFDNLQKIDSDSDGQNLKGICLGVLKAISNNATLFVNGNIIVVFDFGKNIVNSYQYDMYQRIREQQQIIWLASTELNANYVSCCGNFVYTASKDGEIKVWTLPQLTSKILLTVSFDYITAIATNKKYGIIALATKNGYILVYTLKTGQFRFSIKPKGCQMITKLIITNEWGFIISFHKSEIHLWTVNGAFVREAQIKSFVKSSQVSNIVLEKNCFTKENIPVTTWKCERGFDFIAFVDENEHVYCIEAFYLNISDPTYIGRSSVIDLTYNVENRTLIVLTNDEKGTLLKIIPKPLPN